MHESRRSHHVIRVVGWGVFMCGSLLMLGLTASTLLTGRATRKELKELQQQRDELHRFSELASQQRQRVDRDKSKMTEVLRHCRSVKDVPDFGGAYFIARQIDGERLIFYVPAGSHRLEIATRWQRQAAPGPRVPEPSDPDSPEGEQAWTIPLAGDAGYQLSIISSRSGGELAWELTGNDPAFTTRKENIPVDSFAHGGASYSMSDRVLFPNQVEDWNLNRLDPVAQSPPGLRIMDAKLYGKIDDRPYEVAFEVRVLSDGPLTTSVTGAQRLLMQKTKDVQLAYRGAGRYEIRLTP